ncbi:Ly49 inhibitory receptor-like [Rattus norvegicus]|uniref:LOC497796 protein n=2 Tax=Rattus norvegicus TaxID=10116 RepID=Q566Q4_RAT|nr:Ly49 inhibitory receptor-like [Rattus norvegicus]AAH93399.1 LOC497796 protein [Rattus norvegicus]|eukprot:NP_001104780.1 Ly49 inhibitory receptor-like [Rattus norvegicus]
MSEQEVTYSTVRFKKSSEMQNQVRPKEPQRPREAGHRESSVPWQLIVIALGILCSLLLVTVAVLLTKIFQYNHEKHALPEETLSPINNCSTMQSNIDLKEEMLRNMSINCSQGNDLLQSLNREQTKWYSETKTVLPSSQHTGKNVEIYWFCYGIKCYYFILDTKAWNGCKQTCQDSSLFLLKIDDEDELKFLRLQFLSYQYWIGLSYNKTEKEWSWIDNGQSELSLNLKKYNVKDGDCMFLSKARLENAMCSNPYPCICQKRLDKFPH